VTLPAIIALATAALLIKRCQSAAANRAPMIAAKTVFAHKPSLVHGWAKIPPERCATANAGSVVFALPGWRFQCTSQKRVRREAKEWSVNRVNVNGNPFKML